MRVTVYVDESGTHDNSPLIMGGVGARLGQWMDFDRKWQRLLRDYDLSHFHAASMRSSKRDFRHLTTQRKSELIHDINKIVQRTTTWGFSAYLHKRDYEQHYLAGHRPTGVQLDTMYGVCFRMCLSFAVQMAQTVIQWDNPQITFVLEAGHPNAADAVRVFDQVTKGVPELREVLHDIQFATKDGAYGVQAADAIAYTANMMERDGDPEVTDFGPGVDICAARRKVRAKSPIFRIEGRPDILQEMRTNLLTYRDLRKGKLSNGKAVPDMGTL